MRAPFVSLLLLSCLTPFIAAGAAAPNPWDLPWGNLGDGTYRNPILNGDFADSDVEKCGDTWFLITSTNHLAPAMTILESRDLVNWRYSGHVWPRLSWKPDYDWTVMDGYKFGTWAGDLSVHRGTWYCYMIDPRHGLILSTAQHPRGPWSDPVTVLKKTNWTDPAAYWDQDTHQGYLICNFQENASHPALRDQKIFKLSSDGARLLDDGVVVYSGPRSEAAKIHRIDGRWYVLVIDWVGGDRQQIALRSTTDSIYGPYERRVVLHRGNGFSHSASQGSLVTAPDGSWWYFHQLVQNGTPNFQGRPQCLQPVTWVDGWPIIGADLDGDGIGEPVWTHRQPMTGDDAARAFRLATDDEFSTPTLGLQWLWNHNPRDARWSLAARPGWLRLTASQPVGPGGFWKAPNTLSQPLLGTGRGVAVARLDLAGLRPGQVAGLVHFSGQYFLAGVKVAATGARSLFFDANGRTLGGPALPGTDLWIRTTIVRDEATFAWSPDGVHWEPLGGACRLAPGNWRGDRIGLFTWNDLTDDAGAAGQLDVDFFRYTAEPLTAP